MQSVSVEIEGLPYGARPAEPIERREGWYWINVCIVGQHLPQMYDVDDIHFDLTEVEAKDRGLCPDCLGFGTAAPMNRLALMGAFHAENTPERCIPCGGSGRPYLLAYRSGKGVIPHVPIPTMNGTCLACLYPENSEPHYLTHVQL